MYYVLNDYTDVGIRERMGIGSALLGASSCVDAPLRLYKCIRYHRTRGPLMSNEDDGTSADAGEEDERSRWWHLDFSMHIYTVALFAMAFPLAIGPVVDPPIERFFLLTMPILVAPLGLTGFVSLVPFRIPRHVRISSDNHGERVKPLAYYAVEDVCAVDARGGRSFRRAMRRRWRQSPPFRKLLRVVTLWWSLGSVILVCFTTNSYPETGPDEADVSQCVAVRDDGRCCLDHLVRLCLGPRSGHVLHLDAPLAARDHDLRQVGARPRACVVARAPRRDQAQPDDGQGVTLREHSCLFTQFHTRRAVIPETRVYVRVVLQQVSNGASKVWEYVAWSVRQCSIRRSEGERMCDARCLLVTETV